MGRELEYRLLTEAKTTVMAEAGTQGKRGYVIEIPPIILTWAADNGLLRLPASAGPEPCSSGFTARNSLKSSSNPGDKVQKLSIANSSHSSPKEVPHSRTVSKRKRAEASKAPRRQISNAAKPRQPQKARNSKSSKDQEVIESIIREKPLLTAPQKSRDITSSLPKPVAQEYGETGQNENFDETCKTYSSVQGGFWPEVEVSDQSADDLIPRECFEVTSLTGTTQANGYQKHLRVEAEWQPSQEGSKYNLEQVASRKEGQEGRSPNNFTVFSPGDPLELEKGDAKSFNDDYPFDTHINDFPWSNSASLSWGDDDEYPITGGDAAGIMQLTEVEKAMIGTENTSIAQGFDAGEAHRIFSAANACMIEFNADHSGEVDDLFIESLQADWNDSEPEENLTGNGSFAFSSHQLAPRSSPCSDSLDPVSGLIVEVSEPTNQHRSESLYDDEELDRELLNLGSSAFRNLDGSLSSTPPSSPVPVSSPKAPPLEKPTPQPDMLHVVSFDADGKPLPFIRPPFAKPVRDRSVIHALRSQSVLRPCFRVGEALNAGCAAVSSDMDSVIELYARVSSSTREPGSYKQRFRFADLFTADKPPFLTGVYTLWRGVELWDHGSKVFLGEAGKGRMARVVGRMRKEEGNWMMAILCIWQVDWEEVGLAKGIVCS